MNKLKYWISQNRNWLSYAGIPLIILAIIWVGMTNNIDFLSFYKNMSQLKNWWAEWGDPVLGVSTFFVAIIIWLLNLAKDWEDRLPKLLDVTYKLNGRDVIICKNATLAHEGDIRNWGQTLGVQTVGTKIRFNLQQKFDTGAPTIHKSKLEGQKGIRYHKHYTATFYLRDNSGEKRLNEGRFEFDANDPNNDTKTTNYIGPEISEEIKDEKPSRIEFTVDFRDGYGILKFNLTESITPDDLKNLIPEKAKSELFSGKGIVLFGKGPIWLYGYLVHYYHATQWVATHDPRLQGAVVVESHVIDVSVGDIISLEG